MYPRTIAIVDEDAQFSQPLAQHLHGLGMNVFVYGDSNELLADPAAFSRDFFIVDLTFPGVDGVELIKILRKRTEAGVLVVSGRSGPKVFRDVISAGADMHLTKPVQLEQVAMAVLAVHRRASEQAAQPTSWKLDRSAGELMAPDGARVGLSEIDRALLDCFLEAHGQPVTRQALAHSLGRDGDSGAAGLNAVVYRLRRRIERATPLPVPLQSKSRVGYLFKASLQEL